ncbi:MAG: exopolysaccharide biosynthesis polyprenyl glycosylphosphotransferase [Planctomycetaceae bacterium]
MSSFTAAISNPTSTVRSAPVRYRRLARPDREEAEAFARACAGGETSNRVARRLHNRSLAQGVATTFPLLAADVAGMSLVLFAATALAERMLGLPTNIVTHLSALLVSLLLIPIAELAGVYPGLGSSPVVEFRQLVRSALVALLIYAGIGVTLYPHYAHFFVVSAFVAAILAVPVLPSVRFVVRTLLAQMPFWGVPVLIYAETAAAVELFHKLRRSPDRGFRPVGLLLSPDDYWLSGREFVDDGIPIYDVRSAAECALAKRATWVLIGPTARTHGDDATGLIEPQIQAIPNRVLLSSARLDVGLWDHTYTVGAVSGLRVANWRPNILKAAAKRLFDVSVTATALLVGLPLLAAIYLGIRLGSRGPAFYSQERVGLGGRAFKAWKFRTMHPDADRLLEEHLDGNPAHRAEWEETHKLKRDPRVTPIGRLLRATSLDELPQLWNVLRGDMSLVGPRPIVDSPTYDGEYVENYPREFAAYKTVRPGITGLWQVTCRNNGVYEMRIFWDIYYIRNWSPWLDLYILLRTVRTVLLREGAY